MKEIVIQVNGGLMISIDMNLKKVMSVKNDYVWNPVTCYFKNGKYLTSTMDDSRIMCNKITKETVPKNLNQA